MATDDEEVGKNELKCSDSRPTENGNAHFSDQINTTSGWLMKRTKISHKWNNTYFILKDTTLFYGKLEQKASKKINLEKAEISECVIDNKNHAFRIKPFDTKRVFYMYAPDEQTVNMWMQAICFAKATGKSGGNSEACTIQ